VPVQLTDEDFQKLEAKKLANIIRKLHAGKTPTAAEQAILDKARAGGDTSGPRFAANWDELADALGVSRRQLQNWRNDPRYKGDAPKCAPDNRKEIALWMAWTARHGLKSSAPLDDVDDSDDGGEKVVQPPKLGGTVADWKAREAMLKGDKIERELLKEAKTLLVATDLEIVIGTAFVAITNRVNQLAETLAPVVTGQMDVQDVIDLIRPETQSIMRALGTVDYDAELDALLGDLPTDKETERLLQLVTFDGQDVAALHQLIRHCCQLTLRRLGRTALGLSHTPLQDSVTGQTSDSAIAEHRKNTAPEAPDEPEESRGKIPPGTAAEAHQRPSKAKGSKNRPSQKPKRKTAKKK
jgi:hypothetical protein